MANHERCDKIEQAINEALPEMEGHRDGDILVEWVVLTFVTNPDEEQGDAYPRLVSNGRIPTYRVRGLIATALHFLDNEDLGI